MSDPVDLSSRRPFQKQYVAGQGVPSERAKHPQTVTQIVGLAYPGVERVLTIHGAPGCLPNILAFERVRKNVR